MTLGRILGLTFGWLLIKIALDAFLLASNSPTPIALPSPFSFLHRLNMNINNPSSPPRPTSTRRPSNPFTKNQDERDMAQQSSSPMAGSFPSTSSLISRFRNASIGSNNSDTIEEQEDEDLDPVPFRINEDHDKLGSAKGAGTGVFEKADQNSKDPVGLPFRPTLRPAGGSQRRVSIDGIEDPNMLYSQDSDSVRSTSADRKETVDPAQRGTGRSRGIIRTYSMAQQKRRPVIMDTQ
jgi:alpha,alpha-trehalase